MVLMVQVYFVQQLHLHILLSLQQHSHAQVEMKAEQGPEAAGQALGLSAWSSPVAGFAPAPGHV
jgi:hypothetical protein